MCVQSLWGCILEIDLSNDSAKLTMHLASVSSSSANNSMDEFNGATGQLFMDYDLKIRRRLAWAKLVNGNLEIEDKNIQE